MIRMKVHPKQYNSMLPIVEVSLEFYHDGQELEEATTYTTMVSTIEMLEKISKSCKGEFVNVLPRGQKDKKAKLAAFMTFIFGNMRDMEQFFYNLNNMFG